MADQTSVGWRQLDNVLHSTGAVSDCIGRPGILEVAKSTYEQLLHSSYEYYKLRQALVAGGISDEALDILIEGYRVDMTTTTDELWPRSTENWTTYPNVPFVSKQPDSPEYATLPERRVSPFSLPNPPATPPTRYEDQRYSRQSLDQRQAQYNDPRSGRYDAHGSRDPRTLEFSNLPTNATLKDITQLIRGGRLIELHLRLRDRKAIIMLAEGAAEYLAWAHRNDIYIGAKRIEVSWADRQPQMHGQMSSKLANGQTRNIALRGVGNRISEETIRQDLEHIDKLVVTDLITVDRDVFISTNSINLAGYAKLCLTSRAKYKGISISWHPDECAEPLPARSIAPLREKPLPQPPQSLTNRFLALELEEETEPITVEEASSEGSDTSGIDLKPRSVGTASP